MFRTAKTGMMAMTLTASVLTFTPGPAQAATNFANCDAMHRTFAHGVARSRAAARRQVRTGRFRPALRPRVYRANRDSDADNDGTACEVTR